MTENTETNLLSSTDDMDDMNDMDLSINLSNIKVEKLVSAKIAVYITAASVNLVAWIFEVAECFGLLGQISVYRMENQIAGRLRRKRLREGLPALGNNWVVAMKVHHRSARRINLFATIMALHFLKLEYISRRTRFWNTPNNLSLIDAQHPGGPIIQYTNYVGVVIAPVVALPPVVYINVYANMAQTADDMWSLKFSDNTISVFGTAPIGLDSIAFLRPPNTLNADYRNIR
ncbi:polyketide synthase [Acrasis kona]|uniref:Polyketide synthase n=1 Tax=Acrasis kona TaxID=1008807 RepID=A0AAW2Z2W9_9EUKA